MKTKKVILTPEQLDSAYDAYRSECAEIGDAYQEAKNAGNRSRANGLLEYHNYISRQFYKLLDQNVDSLSLEMQNVILWLRQRRDAVPKA